jgi:hypothetical protein
VTKELEQDTGFNISIKDNFFEEELFNTIYNKINYHPYKARLNLLTSGEHPWFAAPVEKDISEKIKTMCEIIWRKKFKINFCDYTLVASVEPLPHCDLSENCDYQLIIYIKGNVNLHKGTGFYLNNELNTHVGFNENRAVLWHANTLHSPLNWASDDKSKRYSIICQLKEI